MTLGFRKVIVVGLVASIMLVANSQMVASWMDQAGLISAAQTIRDNFLTGTAITIILALLVLLVRPSLKTAPLLGRCPVCDQRTARAAAYCSECGSRQ